MALETAQFINGLNQSNPSGADRLHQGDDHIRLVKSVLKNTFPNINGPVELTQDELNATPGQVPPGVILIWYGSSSTVPTGWGLCDGTEYDRVDGSGKLLSPDLRDRAVIGAGTFLDQGETGGEATMYLTTGSAGKHTHTIGGGEHTHDATGGATALKVEHIPAHKHLNGVVDKNDTLFNHGGATAEPTRGSSIDGNSSSGTREGYTTSVGGGQAHSHSVSVQSATHSHTVSEGAAHTHSYQVTTIQPSIGLHFIMKL